RLVNSAPSSRRKALGLFTFEQITPLNKNLFFYQTCVGSARNGAAARRFPKELEMKGVRIGI
ncbi:MAG: hypothetical protein IKM00_08655, partial [Clostridia bacterium]|nr:hypothetical protein [Clostridia bacterium]